MLNVIGINGSPRENGNTSILIQSVFSGLEKWAIPTQLVQLSGKDIQSCRGCFACRGQARCPAIADDLNQCFEKLRAADGVILGSPVYSADITGKMKCFLERAGVITAMNPGLLRHKVGASVAAVRRAGGMAAIDTMNHFFLNKEMLIVGSTYWNMVFGKDEGDVLNDAEGMENMRNLGAQMAWALRAIHGQN